MNGHPDTLDRRDHRTQQVLASDWPKDRYPNFTHGEIACKHCGALFINLEAMDSLQALRYRVGPLSVTSGYRCAEHPAEKGKAQPGAHWYGRAFDIGGLIGGRAHQVLKEAFDLGFTGIGVAMQGDKAGRFLHLDMIDPNQTHIWRPAVWSY